MPRGIRPCQGGVYRDVKAVIATGSGPGEAAIQEWTYPYAVVMSQECDLESDDRSRASGSPARSGQLAANGSQDKLVPAILLCPGYQAAWFWVGTHLKGIGWTMEEHGRKQRHIIKQNSHPRYHYLASWSPLQVPELVVDFKHFFTLPTAMLRESYGTGEHYIACLGCLYREDISHRFAAYLARIGLPVPHHQMGVCAPESEVF